nr:NAD(P)H-dependent glycerol-3-phosphate dehydrogenase [Corynebacterium sp. sy039]
MTPTSKEWEKMRVAIMGAGSWGTTIAKVFADAGCQVCIWARRTEVAQEINHNHRNSAYLADIELPHNLTAHHDVLTVLADSDIVVLAIPSQQLRANLSQWAEAIPEEAIVLSLAKGIEQNTYLRMSEVIAETIRRPVETIAVLSGPNLAQEIAQEQPAATVIACNDQRRAQIVQRALDSSYLRPYTNTDVIGCELAGAAKNVIALACGMALGRGLGENTLATLITRGLAEITNLGLAMGADARTFAGLAGLGDLVATCSSPLSRNRCFGQRLGAGETLDAARAATHGQVAEGVISSQSIFILSQKYHVDMPITEAVYGVCHQGTHVDELIEALMGHSMKAE